LTRYLLVVHQPQLNVVYLGHASAENIASYDRPAETEQLAGTALPPGQSQQAEP